jgi:hypothetical protein
MTKKKQEKTNEVFILVDVYYPDARICQSIEELERMIDTMVGKDDLDDDYIIANLNIFRATPMKIITQKRFTIEE